MKVLKFLGIAIMTTIISISFIACSDDEETNVYNYNLNSDNTILAIDYEDGDGYEKVYLEITDNSLMKWSYINYEGEYTILKRIK